MEIHHATFVLSKIIKQASRQSIMASNMVMSHENIHIHRILGLWGRKGRTWLASIHISMGSKNISTMNIKQIHEYYQVESKINISSKQFWREYHECRAPTKALITFAWVGFMNSIIWNHKIYSCLLKIEKIKKMVENWRK